ncbi:hypothetical protein CFIMG_008668RA00001 [Ceratocystis fimbriata CBS 114723]|uniref:Uncharacterized protein n=1 Tax=Ceratocystis fimbriata CBS 114723 TaxID=1035309 RepID=A0A2C5WVB3_9PEZI|nr:hypothetical protein CFIMG_008668RA00001 [Ceratocystis fimbriata CBS 114723]
MRYYTWVYDYVSFPPCLLSHVLTGGNKPSPTAGLGSTQNTGTPMSTDLSSIGYFTDRGYSLWTGDNVFKVFTDRYSPSSLDPTVHLYVDTQNQAVTIYEDNLGRETRSKRTLKIENVYTALCSRAGISVDTIQWIAMDADDWDVGIMVRDYRQNNDLGLDDFHVTPEQEGWEAFSKTRYFQAAAKMKPEAQINRIDVKKQRRLPRNPGNTPLDVEYLMFSFQQPVSGDYVEDDSTDPTEKDLLEINIKENFDVIAKAAENAVISSSTTRLDGGPKIDETTA